MSTKITKFPKNSNRSIHQGIAIVGRNGLPIDALASIEPGVSLIKGTTSVTYSNPQVTVNTSIDLTNLINYNSDNYKYTGILLFTDNTGNSYFIDKDSINNTTKTFNIYVDEDYTISPSSIQSGSGWIISEAELVNRLQTTSSAVIDTVEFRDVDVKVNLDGSNGDSIQIVDSQGDQLFIENDGSINVNVQNISIDSADGDSILGVGTEDGTFSGTQHVIKVGSDKNLRVLDEEVSSKLDSILTELQQKTEPTDQQNTRFLDDSTDSVTIPGVATEAKQDAAITILGDISSKLNGPVNIEDLDANKDDVAIAGTEDGTATGTVRHFVNNLRLQILAAHDRKQEIFYADFGTKNQRVIQIDYTSPTFPGVIARKALTYTLVGNKYRRDEITWSIV